MDYYTEPYFGLDICDASLKVLQIKPKKHRMEIAHWLIKPIQPGLIISGVIQDHDKVAHLIREALKESHVKTAYVVASIPETKTFSKLLTISKPFLNGLKTKVQEEMLKHVPFDANEIEWDFGLVRQDAAAEVFVVAAPKILIDSYIQLLKKAKLIPLALASETMSLMRALIPVNTHPSLGTLIVDIGEMRTTILIWNGYAIAHSGDSETSGSHLTSALKEALKMDDGSAEEMKYTYGLQSGPEPYKKIIAAYTARLASHITRDIAHYLDQSSHNPAVTEIILTGGGADLKGLSYALADTLKIRVSIGNPWVNFLGDPPRGIPSSVHARLATVIGLALYQYV
ncbi:hypothetical protein A3B21_02530 [Candidatus Uhrbacteria bacterium RIFCSPLOWO2_01_FULL_47_24]|uniref:SHS2 domain-containing protein n=1 Tax=Candidatus Uhrbacteria bacterium RIFCSPLOWO2_01_FULL_47_24 TaxID=1802401 RepID=A0A1F7UP49_9BACT|nr:MAG: hypothetical protein A2753_02310 [Candidatus Uhrbacteria bacterium RIFCSPHIGHO2_01_FULL_47_11]OGL68281.1 MAG: hypothetical protein A3D58_04750 [Candidatus Uhrbacteria bacterium RIFCSPHIGHO2_02_FULL_46_47]OGL75693.1 MAG: hypothetical protein A3F52_01760 [Candidatus Uhrbacteria bacterium RIFCSPHIGHO2_12_FULL_47_11]OGL80019.1 MAG: hypothetical protein A3B21_02530 [Candidatus Uhrbacteria bacterium RIFCSPLOWO2_01_FULL_47_24]OGL85217.1 MAG: hypothetical protein A3J03_00120 [Candidatus Uhrbact